MAGLLLACETGSGLLRVSGLPTGVLENVGGAPTQESADLVGRNENENRHTVSGLAAGVLENEEDEPTQESAGLSAGRGETSRRVSEV